MTEHSTQDWRIRNAIAGVAVSSLLAASFIPSAAAAAPTAPAQLASGASTSSPAATVEEVGIELPEGLQSAHDSVFWADNEACASFSFASIDGPYTNSSSPVLGCVDGYVAFLNKSEEYYVQLSEDEIDGDYTRVMFAYHDGDAWTLHGDFAYVWPYPFLRTLTNATGPALEQEMEDQLLNAGIWVPNMNQLVGPNTAMWTSNEPADSWSRQDLPGQPGVSAEIRDDWTIYRNLWSEGTPDMIMDRFGNYHLSVFHTDSSVETPSECNGPIGDYRIVKSAELGLTSNGEKVKVALVSITEEGIVSHRVVLLPGSATKSGELCVLNGWLNIDGHGSMDPTIMSGVRFDSKKELNSFTKSVAWQDIVRFAGSLQFS
ncbi:hypothetical protein HD598_000384 [Neomicrococcus aestuarii]|uniref:Uncharacterized protein n=1 Tax=Neomicrococcus aestuarii TaxID=556325 RepID=A0A7W8TRP8_9MICC|nr:hypothetical protein [Neomicrococcus aestuarii]MBB5511697.1 hypothetical protein [Neomicrococcus aestuarii]